MKPQDKPEGKPTKVNNKRLKISPSGLVSLPVAARKSLKMRKGEGSRVTVAITQGGVQLAPAGKTCGFRVSAKGQLELLGDAKALLETGDSKHYFIELDDDNSSVLLRPFS